VGDGVTPRDVARENWTTALQTYRYALKAYRRLLEARTLRQQLAFDARPQPVDVRPPALPVRRCVLEGLTPRECEVADLVARGYSNQQIAETLVLTRGTVANHIAHILAKLGATNRTQVAARVLEGATGLARSDEVAEVADPVRRLRLA
jgi:DNA-binding NarL/FixJ family response regulator